MTADDPLDTLSLSCVQQIEHISDSEEIAAGVLFGIQLAVAALSGAQTDIAGRDAVRAGGDIARARCMVLGVLT